MSQRAQGVTGGAGASGGGRGALAADPPAVTDNSQRILARLDDLEVLRVTQIASFFDCPRRWKANLLGEGEQKESKYGVIGTAVHLAIEDYLATRWDFPAGWDAVQQRLADAGCAVAEIQSARAYLLELAPRRSQVLALEWEFTHSPGAGLPGVRGHVDALFQEDDGTVVIRDHKTNRHAESVAWWQGQMQPRLYAWAVRQLVGADQPVDFELGYVNLGKVLRWRTDPADDAATIEHVRAVWHAFCTYQRTGDWPEFINDWCSYCPLKKSCGRLERAQNDFLGAMKKKEDAGWSLARRYQWGVNILKTMEERVADLKSEMVDQVAHAGELREGDTLYGLRKTMKREVTPSDLEDVLGSDSHFPSDFNRCFSVRLAGMDQWAGEAPDREEALTRIVRHVESETLSLTQRKVAHGTDRS